MTYSKLMHGGDLSQEEAQALFTQLVSAKLQPAQIAAVLAVIASRGVRKEEILGARRALREFCVASEHAALRAFDVCGTGGDGKSTFNISTCAAFVIAGTGRKVVKNGNYSASSASGSSNVLEALDVTFADNDRALTEQLEGPNPVFIHAPYFYPILKQVAPIRKELGIRTIFNLLGPLLNPVAVGTQLLGVPTRELMRLYGEVLSGESRNFAVVTSLDGYDEVSLTAPVQITSHRGVIQFTPEDFGFSAVSPSEICLMGGVDESVQIMRAVLSGQGTKAQRAVVVCNAALALWAEGTTDSLEECVAQATYSIESGAALAALHAVGGK